MTVFSFYLFFPTSLKQWDLIEQPYWRCSLPATKMRSWLRTTFLITCTSSRIDSRKICVLCSSYAHPHCPFKKKKTFKVPSHPESLLFPTTFLNASVFPCQPFSLELIWCGVSEVDKDMERLGYLLSSPVLGFFKILVCIVACLGICFRCV